MDGVDVAGLRVTVCLPAEARDEVMAATARAMAPFETDHSSDSWQQDIWDWWAVRGGSDGSGYLVAPGCADDPRLIHDWPRSDGTELPSEPGRCAGGPRRSLDFAKPRAEAEEHLRNGWDLWQLISAGDNEILPLSHFQTRYEPGSHEDLCCHWIYPYRKQPGVREFHARWDRPTPPGALTFGDAGSTDLASRFAGSRDAFMARSAPGALCHSGHLLTLDGWWIEPEPGYHVHGRCADPVPCAHTPEDPRCVDDPVAYLEALPDDALLVRLKCHV
jgi:hypothetical protein